MAARIGTQMQTEQPDQADQELTGEITQLLVQFNRSANTMAISERTRLNATIESLENQLKARQMKVINGHRLRWNMGKQIETVRTPGLFECVDCGKKHHNYRKFSARRCPIGLGSLPGEKERDRRERIKIRVRALEVRLRENISQHDRATCETILHKLYGRVGLMFGQGKRYIAE